MAYSVVTYLPALHRGYLDFFKKYPGKLYIIGPDLLKEVPRLDRDIRALAPEEARAMLVGLGAYESVVILGKDNLAELREDGNEIVLPDEELTREFVSKNIPEKKVIFVPVFLRWDKKISTAEFEVPPNRIISHDAFHEEMIERAGAEAGKSQDWWRQIGAVLVKEKQPLFTAHNKVFPSEYSLSALGDPRSDFDAGDKEAEYIYKTIHAEAAVIAEAARRGVSTEGASLYVTTFPCPVCARSVAVAGIKELYYEKGYSSLDAEDILRAAGTRITLVR